MDHRRQLPSGKRTLDGLTLDTPNTAGLVVHNFVAFVLEDIFGSLKGGLKEPGRPDLIGIGDITGVQARTGAGFEEGGRFVPATL